MLKILSYHISVYNDFTEFLKEHGLATKKKGIPDDGTRFVMLEIIDSDKYALSVLTNGQIFDIGELYRAGEILMKDTQTEKLYNQWHKSQEI